MLGGLLSAYELSGDNRLLALAQDLGKRLLPAFDSPTGLPYQYVNLHTGKVRGAATNAFAPLPAAIERQRRCASALRR
jgi:mannosidase alpha-like ER degradation enhancer 2